MSAESEKAPLKGFFERAKRRGLIEHDGAEMRETGIDPIQLTALWRMSAECSK
jgi:hypothetical protein